MQIFQRKNKNKIKMNTSIFLISKNIQKFGRSVADINIHSFLPKLSEISTFVAEMMLDNLVEEIQLI